MTFRAFVEGLISSSKNIERNPYDLNTDYMKAALWRPTEDNSIKPVGESEDWLNLWKESKKRHMFESDGEWYVRSSGQDYVVTNGKEIDSAYDSDERREAEARANMLNKQKNESFSEYLHRLQETICNK